MYKLIFNYVSANYRKMEWILRPLLLIDITINKSVSLALRREIGFKNLIKSLKSISRLKAVSQSFRITLANGKAMGVVWAFVYLTYFLG